MKSSRFTLTSMLALAAVGMSFATPAQAPRRTRPIRVYTMEPAIDTGASPRATQRRATRNQRRANFRSDIAVFGSARQARHRRAMKGKS